VGSPVTLRHSTPLEHFEQPVQLTSTLSVPFGNLLFPAPVLRAAGAAICLTDVQIFYVGLTGFSFSVFCQMCTPFISRREFLSISFLQVLSQANNGMEETKSNMSTTLPSLRTLWLTGVSFDKGPDALLTFFQSRRRLDVPIEHIHLRDCWEFSEDDAIKLKEFVQDVDWDEIEQYDRDYWVDDHIDAEFYSEID
jgi:hypothetical protein